MISAKDYYHQNKKFSEVLCDAATAAGIAIKSAGGKPGRDLEKRKG